MKIQDVYSELKQLYPDAERRSGLTMASALPAAQEEKKGWWVMARVRAGVP